MLLTETVRRLLEGELPAGTSLRSLGSHGLRDLLEPEEIFQVVAPGLPEQFPPLRTLPSHPTNLTAPPTALIGRDEELATVGRLLGHESSRLVTLTGPGGTGKTRLALEVAAEALDRYPDGVFFVDLSPLTDPALVVPTIAVALGVRETAGEPLRETLTRYLRERRLLLLLDNCEQVLESAVRHRHASGCLPAPLHPGHQPGATAHPGRARDRGGAAAPARAGPAAGSG